MGFIMKRFTTKFATTLILVFAILFITNSSFAQSGVSIGVVEVETIVVSLDEAKVADTTLKLIQKSYADSLKKLEDEFMKKVEQYKKQQAMMAQAQQQKEEESLQKEQQELVALRETFSNEIMKKREALLDPIRKRVKAAIEAVAKEEKFNFVLDKNNSAVLFSEDQFDITHRVIDKLKRNK